MYRLYGIPARYAAGYAVSPEEFSPQEDGSFRAVLTDGQAHAWAEIYVDEVGWIPVEMTPPAEETRQTEMMALGDDQEALQAGQEMNGTDILENEPGENAGDENLHQEGEDVYESGQAAGENTWGFPGENRKGNFNPIQGVLLSAAALTGVCLGGWMFRKKRREGALELWRRAQVLAGMNGTDLKETEIFWMEQLRKAAMKEQFGPAGLSKEEISSSRRLYEQLKRSMIRRFNIWKGM